VREIKEKKRIVEVNNKPLEYIIKVEHVGDSHNSSLELENESVEKWEI